MPGCAAVGCNNRSEKGYIMKCFPRDAKLRKLWQERVGRADWEPSNNSFLCHVHFKPQEWSITHSGRIKLKKGAVPSIFTITSTRKSPKKRMKLSDIKKEDTQNEFHLDNCENDTEGSSACNLEGKDYDYRNFHDVFTESSNMETLDHNTGIDDIVISEKYDPRLSYQVLDINSQENEKQKNDISNLGVKDDKTIIENLDINSEYIYDTNMKRIIKSETVDTFNDSYDEIEEKLKLICHEEPMLSKDSIYKSSFNRKISDNCEKGNKPSNIVTDTFTTASNNKLVKKDISQILIDKRENVEIIFGTESGDEKIKLSHISPNSNVKEQNVIPDDIEDRFSKDEIHVIPNMRAAMKRKRRTREEIMRSIQKSIGSDTENEFHSNTNNEESNNSDGISDKDTDCINENVNKQKFIIKLTGDPDDVSEIIDELSINSNNKVETIRNPENNNLVTSVITVENYMTFSSNRSDENDFDINKEQCIKDREYMKSDFANYEQLLTSKSINSNKSLDWHQSSILDSNSEVQISNINSGLFSQEFESLQNTVKIQEEVIEKLTNQLIIYKRLEASIYDKIKILDEKMKEADALNVKLNKKTGQPVYGGKKYLESKQRLITDLGNRVNYMEGINKKLMKTVTLESQDKRKLESQIKQRDDRIKELNWKLEKASKYLDRAEKNTITYRRKMLNMQTLMRRKKLLDEKMNEFSEMLVNSTKGEFSDKAMNAALEIHKFCGGVGYTKLLDYGFPLPPLPVLKPKYLVNSLSNSDDKGENSTANISVKQDPNLEDTNKTKCKVELDANNIVPESHAKEIEVDSAETVTGTVQDIFDENNDGDFSTNELREHFIMELNTVM